MSDFKRGLGVGALLALSLVFFSFGCSMHDWPLLLMAFALDLWAWLVAGAK